ncbi:hypothetical protein ACFX2I_015233 [Malus domestica]
MSKATFSGSYRIVLHRRLHHRLRKVSQNLARIRLHTSGSKGQTSDLEVDTPRGSYHMDAWLLQSPNLLAFGSLVHSWTLELVLVNWVLFGFVQGELVRALGGAVASTSLLGVPLGHNSSFLQGPTFAPPRIREAIWCGSTNSTTEEGEVNSLKEEVTTLRGQVAAQGERMNMILQALAMSGLQIPTMPAPNVAPPSTSQPFHPDDTE